MEWLKKQFQEISGNVDMLAGLQSDTETLGQAEMLQNNSSVVLADSQNMVYQFAEKVGRDMMFHLHTDPLISLPLIKRVQGQDLQVLYTPEMRAGEWLDYNISCKPQSMARTDPQMQARRIMEFMTAAIPALAQTFQLLGPAFNIEKAMVVLGKKMGIDDLDDLINSPLLMQTMMAQMAATPPDGGAARKMGVPPAPGTEPGLAPQGAGPMGMQPGQPVPGQMGPTGGISPQQEANSARQGAGAESQKRKPKKQQVAA
jgi:hypothetical protein